ncbi:MAG: hypothetical protein H0V72_05705 [Bradyrhizobium sp.]|nr:hypothetical protein [Bradyrhizobium sp.]
MPLHRDIHWIGRQWAVTGHGMQLIDQKLKGFFDVEASRLWEETLIETLRAKEWLNAADFDNGLEVARKRFPAGGVTPSPPVASAAPPVASIVPSPAAASIASIKLRPQVAKLEVPRPRKIDPVASPVALQPPAIATPEPEAAQREPPPFHMLFSGYAKFIRPWRVRMKK